MADESAGTGVPWRKRRSIRKIKSDQRAMAHGRNRGPFAAEAWPPDETLSVATIFLVEAFTPSSAPALLTALDAYPGVREQLSRFDDAAREDSRMRRENVFISLGHVRRVAHFVGAVDRTLPETFSSVDCYQLNVTNSLTLVVAAFTLTPEAGDLTDIISVQHTGRSDTMRIDVSGPLGALRAKLPWSRPKSYRSSSQVVSGSGQRARALEARVDSRIEQAQLWFSRYFHGHFSHTSPRGIPAIPVFLTRTAMPFTREPHLRESVLAYDFEVWTSTESDPWQLRMGSRRDRQQWLAWLAAPQDTITPSEHEEHLSPSSVSHRVFETHFELFGWLGARRLLREYGEAIARMRDSNQPRHSALLPFGRYRRLQDFLSEDALDIATVTRELIRKQSDVSGLRIASPTYEFNGASDIPTEVPPLDVWLLGDIGRQAQQLHEDNDNIVGNLKASAQFQQAITNLRFQVLVVVLTVVTIAVSVVALFRPMK
jgi:hypothetical protein